MIDIESAVQNPEEQSLSYERYCFFGVEFKVGFDRPSLQDIYRNTYAHLRKNSDKHDIENCTTFKVLSQSPHNGEPAVIVENAQQKHLVDIFRRGSNRFRFTIRDTNDPSLYEVADAFLSHTPVMLVGERVCYFLDRERWRAYTESIIFHTVLSRIPHHYAMHAGVVSLNDKAILLCGEANNGKTTLTLGLVREGFKYLSDEIAFIDQASGQVEPFPRALGLRHKTIGMFPELDRSVHLQPTKSLSGDDKWLVDIEEIFPKSLGASCKVGVIIFMEGFSESVELTPISASEALFKCMKYSHTAESDPFQAMLQVASVVESARCYRLRSGGVHDTVRMIADLVYDP